MPPIFIPHLVNKKLIFLRRIHTPLTIFLHRFIGQLDNIRSIWKHSCKGVLIILKLLEFILKIWTKHRCRVLRRAPWRRFRSWAALGFNFLNTAFLAEGFVYLLYELSSFMIRFEVFLGVMIKGNLDPCNPFSFFRRRIFVAEYSALVQSHML